MGFPPRYRSAGEAPTISFTWVDYLSNIAYARFYCCAATTSAATSYFLTTSTSKYATPPYVTGAATYTFDFTFKVPVVVQTANAIFNICFYRPAAGAGEAIVATIYHYDGTTETSMGTATAPTRNVGTDYHWIETFKIALTQRPFKVGEILRIKIQTVGANTSLYMSPDGLKIYAAGDQYGRTTIDTASFVDIPFKIQT